MNDDAVITALRESVTGLHLTTPPEQIVKRGREVRARRRVPAVAGALGAAATAVAVSVALLASHPSASHPASRPGAHLAAWTVTRQADGSIQVTFRDLRDAAGLQRVLRADGVPVSVTFPGPQNPACQSINPPGGQPVPHDQPAPPSSGNPPGGVLSGLDQVPLKDAMVIHPSALPPGDGLTLFGQGTDIGQPYDQEVGAPVGLTVGLVQASPQCTGS